MTEPEPQRPAQGGDDLRAGGSQEREATPAGGSQEREATPAGGSQEREATDLGYRDTEEERAYEGGAGAAPEPSDDTGQSS
jgi:hypothetical protein